MNVQPQLRWILGLLLCALTPGVVHAEGWPDQLFDKMSHDFGYVARGGHYKVGFTITNKLNRRLHISGATPSCRICTVAKLEKDWLDPGESTVLEAGMDTLGFTGSKSVSVTVTFDQPSYGQARLTLQCYSRSDIVLTPGEFLLGTVKRGASMTKTMNIEYAGSPDWKIASTTSTNPGVDLDLKETHRGGGTVGYVLKVTLKPDAPPGPIRDRIVLGINDAYNKSIDVALQGNVQADVSLAPPVLSFGSVPTSGTSTKQVLVRGVKPFRILSIEGDDGPFQIERPEDAKQLHVLIVKLVANDHSGDVSQSFRITTDMDGEAPLKLTVSAKLVPAPRPAAGAQ